MKKIFSILLLSLLVQSVWSQSGEGYDPVNPGDPNVYYTLLLEAAPLSGGTVSPNNRQQLSAGQSIYINASSRLGYKFKQWMMGDSIVSTNSSFYFTMPEHDVVLTSYYDWNPEYNPQNPGDPASEGYSHKVNVYANPSSGGYFNSSSFTLVEGGITNIYAYPREGYRFESWMCNGEVVSTENPLNIRMGTTDIAYTATFVYNPVSPGEPSPNVFNATTGEVVIDNFTSGSLNNTIYSLVGSGNYDKVQSILVIGRMQSSDFGFARSYRNCSLIDLSRTTGYTEVPSWSFERAEALIKLILPSSVERIGNYAFYGCSDLSEIYCYAATPPEANENAFPGVESALVVKVPASAVSLYQKADGWKNYTILPVDGETCSMIINLPSDASDGRYKNMYIELENAISGQTYKYLITDRTSYTFANLIRNTSYNIRVKNAVGGVLGEKEKVMLGEKDLTINFETLRQPQTLTVKVLSPEGLDLTSQTTITWFNEDGSLLANGAKVSGVLEGTNVIYRVALPQALAMQYKKPTDVAWNVKASDNNITSQLQTFDEVALSGRILDVTTEEPITNATITISQLLNGKYTKSSTTRTDNEGKFSIDVFNEQSSMTVSGPNYLSKTYEYTDFNDVQQLGDILLKAISGAVVTVNFTYTESVEDGQIAEVQDWYSDEANVIYSLYNQTQNKAIEEFNIQNGSIVLLEEVAEGDVLNITAKSKTGMFRDVTATATIDARNRASVVIPIVELGGLKAYYTESENNGVVGILYDAEGILLRKSSFNGDTLTVSNLADGSYTLVTMGSSKFFNSVLNMSELGNAGLIEGRDYVSNSISIASGVITTLNIATVPTFDESQFYYTGESTSFSANKSQVTIGNYITLRAKVDFKDEYATFVRDLKLIVDIPESCSFVENSVLAGNGMGGYEVAGNRVTINMNSLDDVVRFCIIPTIGGTCKPSAFVQFNYGGENILQPIGSAYFDAQNLALSVPPQIADSVVVVNGTAQTDCVVKVYDGNVMIGQTRSLANGRWSARVNLYKPYSHSFHNIYAEVETANGQTLLTDTKLVEFDKSMTQLKTITMLYNGNTIVFDQIDGTTSTNTYSYVPGKSDFTFIAQFTKNDTALIKNLEFKVLASDGTIRHIPSTYSSKYNAWVGRTQYDNSSRIPVNVDAEYGLIPHPFDDTDRYEEQFINIANATENIVDYIEENVLFEPLKDEDNQMIVKASSPNSSNYYNVSVEMLDSDGLDLHDFVEISTDTQHFYMKEVFENNQYRAYIYNETDNEYFVISFNQEIKQQMNAHRAFPNIMASFSDVMGSLSDVLNSLVPFAEYYRGCTDYQYWRQRLAIDEDKLQEEHDKTSAMLFEKCPDGSLRVSDSKLEEFYKRLRGIYDSRSYFSSAANDMLDSWQQRLINDFLFESATFCLGTVAKGLMRAGAIFRGTKLGKFFSGWRTGKAQREMMERNMDRSFDILRTAGEYAGIFDFIDFQTISQEFSEWEPQNVRTYKSLYYLLQLEISTYSKKCKKDEDKDEDKEEDDDKNKKIDFINKNLSPAVDPSGYVYEGVSSNRLQGVTATCYYMETTEDMYGVLHDEPKVWDAEEYAQENPLFTDENGMYQWDVPQGLWQVKFEKEGYETTYSEWLPVPPPQLEVNVGMVQSRQPEVKQTHAYKDGIEVEFDKYMLPTLLNTENILVSQNGVYVEGEVKLQNEETAYADDNVKYASKIRFVPTTPFTASEVTLTVANRVKSYAGLQMQDSYQQTFDIEQEIKEIVLDDTLKVESGKKRNVSIQVLPKEAAIGKTMKAATSAEMITAIENAETIIDENGLATFSLSGELPGTAAVTYSVEGYDLEARQVINVNITDGNTPVVAVPTASIASGSSIYEGTSVSLSTTEPESKIYYTLDGSCPCNNTSRILYEGPITINSDVTVKAMTLASDETESDVVTYVYSILQNNAGVSLNNGWNWVSFNMKNDAWANVNSAMTSGVWTVDDEIKNDKYSDSYSVAQNKWFGTLSKQGGIKNEEMYKIHSSQNQTLSLAGNAVNPSDNAITVKAGWNYIGYLPMVNISLADALADYDALAGDVVKSQDAFATYSTSNGWEGDLMIMEVGKGYMLKRNAMTGQTSFHYPVIYNTSNSSSARKASMHYDFPDNMNIIGQVCGINIQEGDSIVALVGAQTRGAGVVDEYGKVYLTIQGDDRAKATIVLQRKGEIVATANAPIMYQSNMMLGTVEKPTKLDFVDNPTETNIGRISAIYNVNGTLMKTKELSRVPVGTYIIYSNVDGRDIIRKYFKKQ